MIHFERLVAKSRPLHLAIVFAVVTGIFLSVLWTSVLLRTDKTETLGAKISAAETTPGARLRVYTEPVSVRFPGTAAFTKGFDGMLVPAGSTVRTGTEGRAGLVYGEGTVTRIDREAQIELRVYNPEPQQITVGLIKGRIWSRVKKLLGTESYRSESDSLVAVVRGTSYGHGILKDGANRATVLEGLVEIQCVRRDGNLRLGLEETAIVNCLTGTGFSATPMNALDREDEWVRFNRTQDGIMEQQLETGADVLGVAITRSPTVALSSSSGADPGIPTPSFVPLNTLRPTTPLQQQSAPTSAAVQSTPVPAVTLTPSAAPTSLPTGTPDPSLTPVPIEILRAGEKIVMESPARISDVTIYGSGITTTTYFRIIDPQGRAYSGKVLGREIPASMSIQFSNLSLCGNYSIEISSQASPQEFRTFVTTGLLTISNCTRQPAPRADTKQQ